MALLKKSSAPGAAIGKIDNVLGSNTRFTGDLVSDGNIRIDGQFEGRVETAGNVIIGPDARLVATIEASVVQVWGAVEGDIIARGRLEILPSGRVFGNLRVASLLIDEGGIFRGECTMGGERVEGATVSVADA
ncbi:MAG: polymer-forming cytoskeletal protein [Chloroflexi bacterium]|jgi:cytoskeletal protein CcmA (bactofilin family)|nr:polymer-forming cytoskeletal protein [Chloroflexota bacterium]